MKSLPLSNGIWQDNEFWQADAMANQLFHRTSGTVGVDSVGYLYDQVSATGRQVSSRDPTSVALDTTLYSATGSKTWHHSSSGASSITTDIAAEHYDSNDRLLVVDHRSCTVTAGSCTTGTYSLTGGYEEYRYDGLGRRILTRDRTDQLCTSSSGCVSFVERVIWDGNQILEEKRASGGNTDAVAVLESETGAGGTGTPQFYGSATYVHGAGIDKPLEVVHNDANIITTYDTWRGIPDQGSSFTGTSNSCNSWTGCTAGPTGQLDIDWKSQKTYTFKGLVGSSPRRTWYGNLITGKQDENGQMYMRNRYYDPTTGRFTQEDPRGLGGGLNAYGFAGGDPINYDDPFGLCKVDLRAKMIRGTFKWHTYVTTTDLNGSVTFFRGGPSKHNADPETSKRLESVNAEGGHGFFGIIATESGDYKPGTVDYGTDHHSKTVHDDDASCDKYNQAFNQTLGEIEGRKITYKPLSQNSNSVAFTLLLNAGIHPPEQLDGKDLYSKAPAYGVELTLP